MSPSLARPHIHLVFSTKGAAAWIADNRLNGSVSGPNFPEELGR